MNTSDSGASNHPPRNLMAVIREQALLRPDAPAIITHDRVFTYLVLDRSVARLAQTFIAKGIKPGEVVGVSMGQTPLHCATLLALAHIGAVSVPLHPALPLITRTKIVEKYQVSFVLSGKESYRIAGLPFFNPTETKTSPISPEPDPPIYPVDTDTPFRITLSSGTTGDPKGIMHSHAYMLDRIEKSIYDFTPHSRIIVMDLNFPIGFVFAFGMFVTGGAVVIPKSLNPADLVQMIKAHRVTHCLLSPVQAGTMIPLLDDEGIQFPALVHLRIVGATPTPKLLQTLRSRFSPNLFVPYGSTEIGVISMATPDILEQHPASSGKVSPWVRVEVVDDNDRPLPHDHSGRLRIKAEGMPESYFNDEVRSQRYFKSGWFYPGDRGRLNGEGLLFLEGRDDDLLNIGGMKINPHDVETILVQHPDVKDAVAFVLEVGNGRQVLAAAVIPEKPLSAKQLAGYCADNLGPLAPRRFFQLRDFPRNSNGKVLRKQMTAQIHRQRLAAKTNQPMRADKF